MWLVKYLRLVGPWWAPRGMALASAACLPRFSARRLVWRLWWRWPRHPLLDCACAIECDIRNVQAMQDAVTEHKGGVRRIELRAYRKALDAVHAKMIEGAKS